MTIADAQADLRRAYVDGGPGVAVSGLVWLAAALVEARAGVGAGFAALFVGGMLIFPAAKLACRALFRRADEAKGNPFGGTVLEGTVAMIAGLFAAWLFLPVRPGLVLPLAAITVGTHYCVFRTTYGDRRFWALATAITAIGAAGVFVPETRGWTALLVASVELTFGALVTMRAVKPGR